METFTGLCIGGPMSGEYKTAVSPSFYCAVDVRCNPDRPGYKKYRYSLETVYYALPTQEMPIKINLWLCDTWTKERAVEFVQAVVDEMERE